MIAIDAVFDTNGSGLWSRACKKVRVTSLELAYVNDEEDFGELRVYFDTQTWNVDRDGLIYTDKLFLHELKHMLVRQGFSSEVDYSESGMQGDDYVSLDVKESFIKSFKKL